MPFYQAIRVDQQLWTHPSFFLFFGYYKSIKAVEDDEVVEFPTDLALGWDIWDDMLKVEDLAIWDYNDTGSAYVQNLGKIQMKPTSDAAFKAWWFEGCFQTHIWLGSSAQGRAAKLRCDYEHKGKGTGKYKGNAKGNRRGKGKGIGLSLIHI